MSKEKVGDYPLIFQNGKQRYKSGESLEAFEVKWNESRSVVSDSLQPRGRYNPLNSPGQNTRVGSLSLLQGIFLIQGSYPGLPHYRKILYQLSHQGSPRILEWVAYPFSSGSSQPRSLTRVSCIAAGFSTNWAIREAPNICIHIADSICCTTETNRT